MTPEQLADDLESLHSRTLAAQRAAAELRRLSAENAALRKAMDRYSEVEMMADPIGWMMCSPDKVTRMSMNRPTDEHRRLFNCITPLYTHPVPAQPTYRIPFGLEGLTDGELRQLAAIARFAALVADHAAQQPLSDEQILSANYPDGEENGPTIAAPDFELLAFARQIEAAHGIGGEK